ncbi:thiopeptide-type bacteriocin biosynthesis protein [Brevibacillus halotolerans]|uniref:thiopeptide-type bacteriocin biosynthesis protein n=1 Tax=Brevibacillus halotolerans TaxID=1507437 RepID=UPI0015EEC063|nr:thiopeptide-type bacteriocin biosynthesis protein [Brevibacillus halotolerans]MBA4534526.1 hypothetical protein [Brevibacillus halotolerans]
MSKKWIYYSVYPGKEAYLDEVVTKIVGDTFRELTACQSVHRWFFIRYVDFEGYHVRLRFQVDDAAEDLYAEKLESRIHTLMDTILSGSAPQIRRLLPMGNNKNESERESAVRREEYEPEYEKYGGTLGVSLSEICFESSSRLALAGLQAERNEVIDRFHLALLLMDETAKQAKLTTSEQKELWNRILHFWSGADYPEGVHYKESFQNAATKRIESLQRSLQNYKQNESIAEMMDDYRFHLKDVFEQIRGSKQIRLPASHFVFHYIHMMNNRLGIWPMEEAYLGALLAAVGKS